MFKIICKSDAEGEEEDDEDSVSPGGSLVTLAGSMNFHQRWEFFSSVQKFVDCERRPPLFAL